MFLFEYSVVICKGVMQEVLLKIKEYFSAKSYYKSLCQLLIWFYEQIFRTSDTKKINLFCG